MRTSGILLHITSLPNPHGIGSLGECAYRFVDFLQEAAQHYWQILPVGPTGYGDSPYQSFSTFAGNPYLIDLDLLMEEGLLLPEEAGTPTPPDSPVDYGSLYRERLPVLKKAFSRFVLGADYHTFVEQTPWLADYALFMALKSRFGGGDWSAWPEELRHRQPEALAHWRQALAPDIAFHCFLQFQFFRQWAALKAYAAARNVEIIGDIPIYVPLDSADVWANPQFFQLDADLRPEAVAGVPPDCFSADGQLWGNPLYNWEALARDDYRWWKNRIAANGRLFDVIRIDHFRGLESYWSVPAGSPTAQNGRWVKGPGASFVNALKSAFPHLRFIAEDLGYLTPEVLQLVADSGFPGMKILEFAFDDRESGNYLPHSYPRGCICYTGTHDNETLVQWEAAITPQNRSYAREYLGLEETQSLPQAMLRAGLASVADTFLAQMSDWLGLGGEARMNHPGVMDGTAWRWRCPKDTLTPRLAKTIAHQTRLYHRDCRDM